MKLTDKFYGYPVLSIFTDDYEGEFDVDINATKDEKNDVFLIKIIIKLENNDIHNLIKDHKAIFSLHLEESKTCYRSVVQFYSLEHEFEIPFSKVRESIEVCPFITTTKEIRDYRPNSTHEFFNEFDFSYEPYQIIGIAQQKIIEVSKENDEIKNSSSIFSIIPDKMGNQKFIQFELAEERIIIIMPVNDFDLYYGLTLKNQTRNNNNDILLSNIVMPIMVDLLYSLKKTFTLYEDKIWFKSLTKAYSDKKIDIKKEFEKEAFNSYYYAQVIFDSIISKSLLQVDNIMNEMR